MHVCDCAFLRAILNGQTRKKKTVFTITFLYLTDPTSDGVEVLRGSQFGRSTGPIFLDQLGCSGTENSLLQCNRYAGLGLHSCDHSQDAGVRCIGEKIMCQLEKRLTP